MALSPGSQSWLAAVAVYAAPKAAVLALNRSLAVAWARDGINLNAIAPRVFRTDLNAALLHGAERGRELRMAHSHGRFSLPKSSRWTADVGVGREPVAASLILARDAHSWGMEVVTSRFFPASRFGADRAYREEF